jgi:hypothetical protein
MFLNGCDGSPLTGEATGLSSIDVCGDDLTEEEAKEQACELAQRLSYRGAYLVSAYRIEERLCVQLFEGRFVNRMGDPIPENQLPPAFREQPEFEATEG